MNLTGDHIGYEQAELLAFSHDAIRAPRPCTVGEMVMSDKWLELMDRPAPTILDECDEYHLRMIMSAYPFPLTQRVATVAASFVQWLGTNCGRCFLHDAERIAKTLDGKRDAWLAAWAIDNARHAGMNGGVRTIEAALAPSDHWENGRLVRLPDLTAQDHEAVEHVVLWLGMPEGQAFIAECEREITDRLDGERRARMADWKRANTKPTNKRDAWR
jgi:hypothetical protein